MKDVKKIVCPTDFSDASYVAVDVAGALAERFSAELILVHVVIPIPLAPDMEALGTVDILGYEKGLREQMEQLLREEAVNRVPAAVTRRVIVAQGEPATRIVEIVAEQGADWIVIATHGMTGWRHYVFGSVAQKVIQHAHCPVLTVRAPAEPGSHP